MVSETTPLVPVPVPVPVPASSKSASQLNDNDPVNTTKNEITTTTVSMNVLNYSRLLLYCSHLFENMSEMVWQFSLILFLSYLTDYQSMTLVSTYGLVSNAAVCLFGTITGQYIDTTTLSRLNVARVFIWIENFCVILASIICYILLQTKEQQLIAVNKSMTTDNATISDLELTTISTTGTTFVFNRESILLLIGLHILGPIALILDSGFLVAVERDWVVVLGQVSATIQMQQQTQQPSSIDRKNGDTTKSNYNSTATTKTESSTATATTTSTSTTSSTPTTGTNTNVNTNKWLSETNATMKQLDLVCKIIAPALSGIFIDYFGSNSMSYAAFVISILNVLSLIVEYICTAQIYYLIPELSISRRQVVNEKEKKQKQVQVQAVQEQPEEKTVTKNGSSSNGSVPKETTTPTEEEEEEDTATSTGNMKQTHGCLDTILTTCITSDTTTTSTNPFVLYFQQTVWYSGIGLSLLYFNALTFGGIMINYLLYRGMTLSTVGTLRGVSSTIGLLGTFIFSLLIVQYNISLRVSGMYSVVFQLFFISFSVVSMFITYNYTVSITLLIVGVCISRIGLYVFELTVIQLMQEYIPSSIRGTIGGIQNSFNAFFQLSSFAVCLYYNNPNDFIIIVLCGYCAVIIATLLFAYGIYTNKLIQ